MVFCVKDEFFNGFCLRFTKYFFFKINKLPESGSLCGGNYHFFNGLCPLNTSFLMLFFKGRLLPET